MENGIQLGPNDQKILKALKLSLNQTVEKLKKNLKPSAFAQCFPTLAKNHGPALEMIQSKVLERLSFALYSDLSDAVDSEVAENLNKLSNLIKSNSNPHDFKAWRPSGDPHKDMVSYDVKVLEYEKNKLREVLEAQKRKRHQLFDEVKIGRKQCHENHLIIEEKVNSLKTIQELCNEGLSDEVLLKQTATLIQEDNCNFYS